MRREVKQFLYGGFYLIIIGLIVWWVYGVFFAADPTCFDNIKNQGEAEIDCGGHCISCERASLKDLEVSGDVSFFTTQGGILSLLGRVRNLNSTHSAEFSYQFDIYDSQGRELDALTGEAFIFSADALYLSETVSFAADLDRAELQIFDVNWRQVETESRPQILLTYSSTTVSEDIIKVEGSIKNESSFSGFDILVTVRFKNKFGFNVFASKALVRNIASFAEEDFRVILPADPELLDRIDAEKTEILLYPQL